jgi:hypothetical protein
VPIKDLVLRPQTACIPTGPLHNQMEGIVRQQARGFNDDFTVMNDMAELGLKTDFNLLDKTKAKKRKQRVIIPKEKRV